MTHYEKNLVGTIRQMASYIGELKGMLEEKTKHLETFKADYKRVNESLSGALHKITDLQAENKKLKEALENADGVFRERNALRLEMQEMKRNTVNTQNVIEKTKAENEMLKEAIKNFSGCSACKYYDFSIALKPCRNCLDTRELVNWEFDSLGLIFKKGDESKNER